MPTQSPLSPPSHTPLQLPPGWLWVKLGEVCILNPRRGIIERNDNTITTFIPMESVDAITGTIISPQEKKYKDVKK